MELIFKPLRNQVIGQHTVAKPIDGNVTNGAKRPEQSTEGIIPDHTQSGLH